MTHSLERKFHCPVELALELVGGKWKTVLLAHLKERPRGYAELRRLVPKLSDKMLTQRLADLSAHGLVRKTRAQRPAYALTDRGRRLAPALSALYAFGESVAEDVGAIIEPPAPRSTARRTAR